MMWVICVVLFVFVLVVVGAWEACFYHSFTGELDALPSGKQLQMLGDPALGVPFAHLGSGAS